MSSRIDWRPTAPLDNIRLRARLVSEIRAFFQQRDVLEVDTPLLCQAASTDPHLESFSTHYLGPGAPAGNTLYLPTSPEFAMKRLLAAGSGPIYQICKSFRNGESGRFHNPEFTMLEWYRPGFNHHALMDEVEALVIRLLGERSIERLSYQALFQRYVGLDPFTCSTKALSGCLKSEGVGVGAFDGSKDDWLSLVMTHIIEPRIEALFVFDFPASQAMLARVRGGNPAVAERFELYMDGVELANGFYELSDSEEQRRRFAHDAASRKALGLPEMPLDEALLAALQQGLPDCAGVALGVDRLLMLACGAGSIGEVIAFPLSRC